jgi:pimeloyl-ACP methyl ester carboxylesterase
MRDQITSSEDERVTVVQSYRPLTELIPSAWQRGEVVANGITQRYYRTGGGRPPLVLLHGILEGALAWLPTARALQDTYDVIMLDARGHGGSARVSGDYQPETLAADVVGALDALGLRGVRLLGFSQGATTAALVAADRPDLVSALVLAGLAAGDAPTGDPMTSPGYRAWLASYTAWLEQLKPADHAERMRAGLAQLPPGAPLPPEEEYVVWVENSASLDLELVGMSARLWGQLAATVAKMDAAIARLTCPTLILKSGLAPVSSGPLALREEPSGRANLSIVHFENTGHLLYRDRFSEFVMQVRQFFAAHAGQDGRQASDA